MKEYRYFTIATALMQVAIGLLMLFMPYHLPRAFDPFRTLFPWYALAWIIPGLLRLFLRIQPGATFNVLIALWSAVNFILLGMTFSLTAISGTTTYVIVGVMILLTVISERV